jgi:hypothetical protein
VVVCFRRNISDADCIVYSKFSINKSSGCKSSEEFENGVIKKTATNLRAMLADEYVLIVPFAYQLQSGLHEHNRALEYNFSILSLLSNSSGLKYPGLSATPWYKDPYEKITQFLVLIMLGIKNTL